MIDLARVTSILSAKQIRAVVGCMETPQIALLSGAVSAGKTIASLIAFLILVAAAPDHGLIVIVGRTLQTIERNIVDPLQSWHLFGMFAGHIHHTKGATTATILGRTVHLVGAGDSKAEGRIRGATIALAYVDEASLVPRAFWLMLLSRLRVKGARLVATTNPDGPAHWLKTEFIDRGHEVGLRYFGFTLDDNPSLDPTYVARLKRQYTGHWHRRFILGLWTLAEGAIYEAWDPDRHIVDHLPHIDRWIAGGIDHGTTNPFAALALGVGTGPDNIRRLYVTNELRYDSKVIGRQATNPEYSRMFRDWIAGTHRPGEHRPDGSPVTGLPLPWTYIDPSAADFALQLYRDGYTRGAHANNEVLPGLRSVAGLVAADLVHVHRSCRGLIGELPGYSWDEAAAKAGEDKPVKENDHSCDALRYAVHSSEIYWHGELAAAA